jgi:hypothetical protein
MRKFLFAALILAIALPGAFAQSKDVKAVYIDADNPAEAFIYLASGRRSFVNWDYDYLIPAGTKIETKNSTIELKLKDNGSILKIGKNTVFSLTNDPKSGADVTMSLSSGRVRMVAAKGTSTTYSLKTPSTACGVRGTDFGADYDEATGIDNAYVLEGAIDYFKLDSDGNLGQFLSLTKGFMASAAQGFAAFEIPADFFQGLQEAMSFFAASISEVPGYRPEDIAAEPSPEPSPSPEPVAEASPEPTPAPSPSMASGAGGAEVSPDAASPEAGTADAGTGGQKTPGPLDPVFDWLRETMGMQIGSITLEGKTYATALLQPNLAFGKFKLGLYLPIIYEGDLFDPNRWYRPAGNDEWSFGFDYFATDVWKGVGDFLSDLMLKIRYVEYGTQLVDPFYLKVGNLNSMTIGHGVIMQNYANDYDFPAIRRVGLNFGLDFGGFGFEAVANDLSDPEVLGTRIYVRPLQGFPLAFGLSAIADLFPSQGLSSTANAADYGDPALIGVGVDMDLPIVTSDFLSLRLFADAAGMVPYVRTTYTVGASTVTEGLKYEVLWDGQNNAPRNFGAVGGLMGNVLLINYRLDFRYFTGMFKPSIFNSVYDRSRGAIVTEYRDFLANLASATDQKPYVMGIYGSADFSLMDGKIDFGAAYMWPWNPEVNMADLNVRDLLLNEDFLHMELALKKGIIPNFGIAGSVYYDRKGLAKSIVRSTEGEAFRLIDESTILKGELSVPIAPMLDLAIVVGSAASYAENGQLRYYDGKPLIVPTISMETRFHF